MKTNLFVQFFSIFIIIIVMKNPLMAQDSTTNVVTDTSMAQPKNKLSGYFEVNYKQHYLWRGILWGSNDVSQPELHLDYGNFSLAFCANLNIIPKNLPKEFYKKQVVFDEQDLELSYQNNIGKLEYQALVWAYFYFNQIGSPSTSELNINFSYPVAKNLKVFTENIADLAAYRGGFYNCTGLEHEVSIKKFTIGSNLFAAFGNNKFTSTYFDAEKGGLNLIGSKVALNYSLKNNFYLGGYFEYNQYTSRGVKNSTGLSSTDNFVVTFGREF